jgi:lambda family phage tail tape measure protein
MAAFTNKRKDELITLDANTWDQMLEYEKLTGEKMEKDQLGYVDAMLIAYKETLVGGVKSALDEISYDWSNIGKQMGDFTKRTFDSMADALATFCVTGQADFTALAQSILKDLIKIQIQAALSSVTSGISLSGLFSSTSTETENWYSISGMTAAGVAKGAAFDKGNVIPFARGGIVRKPTLFPMAGGAGLMGEAGPEGVLPLARTSKGDLGVKTSGVGGGDNYSITILAVDSKSFADICDRNPAALIAPITKAMKYNQLQDWSRMLGTKR